MMIGLKPNRKNILSKNSSEKSNKKPESEGFLKNPFFSFLLQKAFWAKIKSFLGKNGHILKLKDLGRLGGGFYFILSSLILMGTLLISSSGLAQLSYFDNGGGSAFFNNFSDGNSNGGNLFFNQNNALALETPDLKTTQDGFIYGISTPDVLTPQTLGDVFGGSAQDRKEVINYSVQPGDTVGSVAKNFNISLNTLLWANNLSAGSSLKTGQSLVILPVSGVIRIVKSGDTISQIARTYRAKADDIVSYNNLASENDIFIGDILIIPDGVMPKKSAPSFIKQTPLPDSFFIYPAEGIITQGLHFFNAVDLANKCGTPVYAAASGTVERAQYGWNYGGGNLATILHPNGIVTYYGHLMSISAKPGDTVNVGDRIGLMGETGKATGCHVHFDVIGAVNPLAKYPVGTMLKYK